MDVGVVKFEAKVRFFFLAKVLSSLNLVDSFFVQRIFVDFYHRRYEGTEAEKIYFFFELRYWSFSSLKSGASKTITRKN